MRRFSWIAICKCLPFCTFLVHLVLVYACGVSCFACLDGFVMSILCAWGNMCCVRCDHVQAWHAKSLHMLRCALCKLIASLCMLGILWLRCFIWPVLKHGPRSLKHVQVFELIIRGAMKMIIGMCAPIANQLIVRGLSLSMYFRTRKMVSYAWEE